MEMAVNAFSEEKQIWYTPSTQVQPIYFGELKEYSKRVHSKLVRVEDVELLTILPQFRNGIVYLPTDEWANMVCDLHRIKSAFDRQCRSIDQAMTTIDQAKRILMQEKTGSYYASKPVL